MEARESARRLLNSLLEGTAEPVTWHQVLGALWVLIKEPGIQEPADEEMLLKLLRFEGRFSLVEGCECPHSLSPEDMSKSLAIQALGRYTGTKYRQEMLDAAWDGNNRASLRSIAEAVLRKAEGKV